MEPSWAKKYRLTLRGPSRPGPGEGVGGGVKFSSSPASRLAHSPPPSQHTSSTRDSACSAAVFGWTATGNQNRLHVRDAGARCPTRARCARRPGCLSTPGAPSAPDAPCAPHVPHVPRAPGAPGASSAPRARRAQTAPGCASARDSRHWATCLSKPIRRDGGVVSILRGVCVCVHVCLCPQSVLKRFLTGMVGLRAQGNMLPPAVPVKKQDKVIVGRPNMI